MPTHLGCIFGGRADGDCLSKSHAIACRVSAVKCVHIATSTFTQCGHKRRIWSFIDCRLIYLLSGVVVNSAKTGDTDDCE